MGIWGEVWNKYMFYLETITWRREREQSLNLWKAWPSFLWFTYLFMSILLLDRLVHASSLSPPSISTPSFASSISKGWGNRMQDEEKEEWKRWNEGVRERDEKWWWRIREQLFPFLLLYFPLSQYPLSRYLYPDKSIRRGGMRETKVCVSWWIWRGESADDEMEIRSEEGEGETMNWRHPQIVIQKSVSFFLSSSVNIYPLHSLNVSRIVILVLPKSHSMLQHFTHAFILDTCTHNWNGGEKGEKVEEGKKKINDPSTKCGSPHTKPRETTLSILLFLSPPTFHSLLALVCVLFTHVGYAHNTWTLQGSVKRKDTEEKEVSVKCILAILDVALLLLLAVRISFVYACFVLCVPNQVSLASPFPPSLSREWEWIRGGVKVNDECMDWDFLNQEWKEVKFDMILVCIHFRSSFSEILWRGKWRGKNNEPLLILLIFSPTRSLHFYSNNSVPNSLVCMCVVYYSPFLSPSLPSIHVITKRIEKGTFFIFTLFIPHTVRNGWEGNGKGILRLKKLYNFIYVNFW